MERKSVQCLPPLKRFKFLQQKEITAVQEERDVNTLPAKKRKHFQDPQLLNTTTISPTTLCLPAKKRIYAFHPFDLNNFPHSPEKSQFGAIKQEEDDDDVSSDILNKSPQNSEINYGNKEEEDEEEDGIQCAVCNITDADPTDPIVFCDGCDLMVHASCYGHPLSTEIPEGDWFCARCISKSETSPPSCCLCSVSGGALKPTTDGRWAHLVCAIYVPEVFFLDSEGREGIDCSKIVKRRWEGVCCVCEKREVGCVIDCSEPKCGLGFHVTCGLKEGFCVEYRQGKKKREGGVVAAFCREHTELWKKQEQSGKFRIVPREHSKN